MSSLPEFAITTGDLRVVFQRREDRWAHRVELVLGNGKLAPLFESVEGSPLCVVPPSPPIQELQLHGDGDAATLLGVGMAGRNHWSLTCGVRHASDSPIGVAAICVEVACRVKDDTPMLASTYRLLSPAQIAAVTNTTLDLSVTGSRVQIRPQDATASTTMGGFVFHARDSKRAMPRTVQWSYTIERPTSA